MEKKRRKVCNRSLRAKVFHSSYDRLAQAKVFSPKRDTCRLSRSSEIELA
ncbi:hypothetical protein DEO72_LG2g3536 [Vigna unguiculata]|uniref:Uncharacterized protein n=1 Tax=Vigna unguiculata TaxID=3917 RepID=A0A4D6L3W4_VIGUN|nr:hypothetical protein DEO72_LG2g3536 [Vigna unguiculata]